MMNIYTGNVITDAKGEASVQLPEWFEVLNTDFRYQLTVIGQFAQAIVARKIESSKFQIRTNAPNVEVSWQITGVRQDAFAKAHPLVVEQKKDARLQGFYIRTGGEADRVGAPSANDEADEGEAGGRSRAGTESRACSQPSAGSRNAISASATAQPAEMSWARILTRAV